ncbi:hypothetical protein HN371_00975 [Candidatus Poribacteria bacterium]|nr:hypothetical protein [Candidatus Poribacteria bacterium]
MTDVISGLAIEDEIAVREQVGDAGEAGWRDVDTAPSVGDVPQIGVAPAPRGAVGGIESLDRSLVFRVLLGAWLLGVMLQVLRLLVSHMRLRRLLASGVTATDRAAMEAMADAQIATGFEQRVRLLRISGLQTPFACLGHPSVIALPLDTEDRETLRVVLAHELAHLQQHDEWWNLLHRLVGCLLFFHPPYRVAVREFEAASEELCDAVATRQAASPRAYALCLLDVVRQRAASGQIALGQPGRRLARRLTGILSSDRRTELSPRRLRGAVALCLVGVTSIACVDLFTFRSSQGQASAGGNALAQLADELGNGLSDADVDVRLEVVRALGTLGRPAVPLLSRALADTSRRVRLAAVEEIGGLGQAAADAVPLLLAELKDESGAEMQCRAAEALGRIGSAAREAAEPLQRLARHDDARLRATATAALAATGVPPETVVPQLIEALEDPSDEVRERAAEALVSLGEAALPLLVAALPSAPAALQAKLVNVLGDMSTPAVAALVTALSSSEQPVRREAADALGDLRVRDAQATAALVRALSDPSIEVRWEVVDALGDIGIHDEQVEAGLVATLADEDPDVRLRTLQALREVGVDDRILVPALLRSLKDRSERVRDAAREELDELVEARARGRGEPAVEDPRG